MPLEACIPASPDAPLIEWTLYESVVKLKHDGSGSYKDDKPAGAPQKVSDVSVTTQEGAKVFSFAQLHVHAPAEHYQHVAGLGKDIPFVRRLGDLEFHLVHANGGERLVTTFFFRKPKAGESQDESEFLKDFINNFEGNADGDPFHTVNINIGLLIKEGLAKNVTSVPAVTFLGTLTTPKPGTSDDFGAGVRFILLTDEANCIKISEDQLKKCHLVERVKSVPKRHALSEKKAGEETTKLSYDSIFGEPSEKLFDCEPSGGNTGLNRSRPIKTVIKLTIVRKSRL